MKKHALLIVGVAVTMLAALLAGLTAPSNAAAPKEKVQICHRTGSESHPYVLISVPKDKANGHITGTGKQHNHNVFWKSDGQWDGIAHSAGDEKLDYYAKDGVTGTCSEGHLPPPPPPPNCHKKCAPAKTKHGGDLRCVGIHSGHFGNVTIPKGKTCMLLNAHVNGNVITHGAKNVFIEDTTVVGSVRLHGVRKDVRFSNQNGCRYDPVVGGSILVKGSHNVLICMATVCHRVTLAHNDGQITLRDSRVRRVLRVNDNHKFRADGPANHARPAAIRLLETRVGGFKAHGNAPRQIIKRHFRIVH